MTRISLLTNDGALKLSEQGMNFPIEKVTKTVSLFTSCLGSGQLNDQNTGVRRQRHNTLPVRFPHRAEEFLPSTVELLERKYNAEKEMGFLSHTHSQIKMAPRKERFLISGPNNRKNTAPPLFLFFFFFFLMCYMMRSRSKHRRLFFFTCMVVICGGASGFKDPLLKLHLLRATLTVRSVSWTIKCPIYFYGRFHA